MINEHFADNDVFLQNCKKRTPANPFEESNQKTTQNLFVINEQFGSGNDWDIRSLLPVEHVKFSEKPLGPGPSTHGCEDANVALHKAFRQQEGSPITFNTEVGVLFPQTAQAGTV